MELLERIFNVFVGICFAVFVAAIATGAATLAWVLVTDTFFP